MPRTAGTVDGAVGSAYGAVSGWTTLLQLVRVPAENDELIAAV
jgi:hypothetical protein